MRRNIARSGLFIGALAPIFAAALWLSPVQASESGSTYTQAATFAPLSGGTLSEPLTALPTGLAAHHYVEEEFSASGDAHAFQATSSPSDGRWTVEPTSTASYRTRVLVRRPANPQNFSGTVVVEWMNESAGESAPEWIFLNPEIMNAGDAWVGVSAQELGVDGGSPLLSGEKISSQAKGLVQEDPTRYGTLHHPGDQYSYDIYDQVAFGIRDWPSKVLGPLRPRHILAVGESQSAAFLTTFADAIEPHNDPYDGIFIHSRGATGAPLDGASITSTSASTAPLRIRTDLRIPVFMSETQTDLIELGFAAAQQPNSKLIRTWEIAGTSHGDSYELGPDVGALGCTNEINTGPQHVVVQAAFADFSRWVTHGTEPPSPAPFKLSATTPATLAVDQHGNVIGGVRTPAVDVPVSTLTGAAPAGTSVICSLFGTTTPFSPQKLAGLYGSKANYVSRYTKDLDRAIADRYLLPADRSQLLSQAQEVQIPSS
jgi:hypothetical protein